MYIYIYTYIYIITVLVVTNVLNGLVTNQEQNDMESAQYLGESYHYKPRGRSLNSMN